MGKTRDLFKKIRDTKTIFDAKMDMIKDRNSKNLTDVEEIKKRWQEYTEQWRDQAPWLQIILQSCSNQDSMILAQKQKYRPMEQDRAQR